MTGASGRWRVRRAYWKRHIKGARVPKKEKSPRAETRVDGRRNEHPRRDKTSRWRFTPVTSPSIPRLRASAVSSFSVTSWLYQLADGGIALRPIPLLPSVSSRGARHEEDTKTSRRLGGSGGRETACLRGAPRSLVPTSRFAFYIIFILLHFSRDKCLRGFASRLGKYFHNVLLCRPPRLVSLRFAASLWFPSSPAHAEQRNKITPTCAFVTSTERN